MGLCWYSVAALVAYVLYKVASFVYNIFNNPLKLTKVDSKPLEFDKEEKKKILKNRFMKNEMREKYYDAIIIGSGMGGLTCAGLLARQGKKVLVLEQHTKAGGCTHTYKDHGYEFDVGVHYIGELFESTFPRIAMDLVTDKQLEFDVLDQNFDDVIIANEDGTKKVFSYKSGKHVWEENIKKQFPNNKADVDKLMKFMKETGEAMVQLIMIKCLPKFVSSFMYKLPFFATYKKLTSTSLEDVTNGITQNPDLKAMLQYCFGDYGTVPSEAPAMMQGTLLYHFYHGAYYPRGGPTQFALTMIPAIERAGGSVQVRAPVNQIIFDDNNNAKGVAVNCGADEVEVYAPIVISDAGVFNTFDKLVPKSVSKFASPRIALDNLQNGMACMQLFVGLKGTTKELELKPRNYWMFTGTDLEKESKEYLSKTREEAVASRIPILFASFPSAKDSDWERRHPGKSVCVVVTFTKWEWFEEWKAEPFKRRGKVYQNLKQEFQNKMWNQVVEQFPQLKDKVDFIDVGTPLSHSHYIACPKGEIYGVDHNMQKFQSAVDLHPDTGIPGLYITGQDVVTAGVSGAFLGGIATATAILGPSFFLKLIRYVGKEKAKLKKNKKVE